MNNPKIIAFYLPQYHPIPENDHWWGKGFTDWVNVVKSEPRFSGHHQPQLPSELGFYDLRLEETRIAQADLASKYGITGFCYYHYWFNEKMLLEKPFNEVLQSGKPDFPFCLCWANENWTRRWDGLEKDILIEQKYDDYDPERHMIWLTKAFSDKRYIRIDDKPVFLIYNIYAIHDIEKKIYELRLIARRFGFPGLYLCSMRSGHNKYSDDEIMNFGFDALVDFIPNFKEKSHRKISSLPKNVTYYFINKIFTFLRLENKIKKLPVSSVYDYKKMAKKIMELPVSKHKIFHCIMPGWDNSARKKYSAVIQNDDSEIYKKWLHNIFKKIINYSKDEQIVFINAWNEWAEGCHLEPDLRNGRKFLEATLETKMKWQSEVLLSLNKERIY